ncbi:MAG: hypothetical protein H6Q61_881 [Firmicutes bacterium]|nr:hypothetical protein [Bacillota bacterium]
MSVAFYGTQETVLSFEAGEVTPGYPVAISQNNTVANAPSGIAPAGVAIHVREGIAAVQLHGYTELPYSGTAPTLGWAKLVADGAGGMKTDAGGIGCLVVSVNETGKTLGMYL